MIGKVIKSILSNDATLTALVAVDNICPYFLNENTELPAIVYIIDGLKPDYNKDGWVLDGCSFSVISLSNNYTSLQAIVAAIRDAMELTRGTIEGITIQPIYITNMDEGYDLASDIFANKLSFNVNVINY
jgi:hypothetical protein